MNGGKKCPEKHWKPKNNVIQLLKVSVNGSNTMAMNDMKTMTLKKVVTERH